MAENHDKHLEEEEDDEEFIDMEIRVSSPPQSKEFEFQFQMSANLAQRESSTSPADELFYKGKLLPLHLPRRSQMVQKLLEQSYGDCEINLFQFEKTCDGNNNVVDGTPFDSCDVSPASSCYASGELNPEDYFYDCSSSHLVHCTDPKKSWSKKLNLTRQSYLITHKLRASGAYLKSLFTKQKSNTTAFAKRDNQKNRKIEEDRCCSERRRSFSGVIKWQFRNKSSSPSVPTMAPQVLRRSSSVKSEGENSIQGAIAYCKMTQQMITSRKSVSDIRFYSSTASRVAAACENQGRQKLCRG